MLVGLGHGEDERLLRALRVHGNPAEYLPPALLLPLLLELQQDSVLLVTALLL